MAAAEVRKVDTGIIQRGKTYRFTAYLGYDRNGKQIRKTMTFVPPTGLTQKKADKLAKEEYIIFCNRCKGLYNLQDNMRFSEIAEEYFKLYAPNKLKPVTAYNYEKLVNYHFMDYFGNKKLKDITPAFLSHFFLSHEVVIKGHLHPLSPANAKKLYTILQSIFTFAVSQGYIKETPCKNVILPQKSVVEEEKRKYLTAEELPEFLSMFQEYSTFHTIILTLLFTGMRAGECLGLQWEDIDFENRKIHIHRTLSSVGGKYLLTTPKTPKSNRYQYMNDTLVKILKKHRTEQKKWQLVWKNSFEHPEMVFTSISGNYKDISCLNRQFKRLLKGTKYEFMTLHKLRHTNATLLVNNGIDLKIVSEHLGHSDISVTADIYAAVLDNSKQKTSKMMEEILTEQAPNKHQIVNFY